MSKILIEKTGQGMAVVNKLSPTEEVNEYEYEIVAGDAPAGLLSVVYEKKKNSRALSCDVTGMAPLRSYLSGIVTQKMFKDTLAQLISIVGSCEDSQLDVRNLCLSLDYIYVEPRTKEIKCILWPLSNNQRSYNMEEFFRELPYSLVFNKHEDCAYVADYIQFFRTLAEPFSVRDLEQLYSQAAPVAGVNEGDAAAAAAPKPSYDPVKRVIEQKAGVGQRNVCPSCGVANAIGTKICVSCGTALIEQGGPDEQPKGGTGVLGYSPGYTGTEAEESPYPYLIRESTNQIISVDKPAFRMGKDKDAVDFCVAGNSAISRNHAVIHIKEDRYFVVDQNSTNKTYVDGRAIQPNEEVEIFPGTKIKMADEEFVFYI